MSKIVWCDLNNDNNLRLLDFCPSPKCICEKQNTFTSKQFQLEVAGFKNAMKKRLRGSQKTGNSFLKPTINTLAPVVGMVFGVRNKNPEVGQATTNILTSISGGKQSSLTDMHGIGLGLNVR